MSLYDTKVIVCSTCKKAVGEVELDALVIRPLCGQCVKPIPIENTILYVASHYHNRPLLKIPQ